MSITHTVDPQTNRPVEQCIDERKQYDFTFAPRLPTSVTVSSAVARLRDPDGNWSTPATAVSVSSPVATVTILGTEIDDTTDPTDPEDFWLLACIATLSNSETAVQFVNIHVPFDATP